MHLHSKIKLDTHLHDAYQCQTIYTIHNNKHIYLYMCTLIAEWAPLTAPYTLQFARLAVRFAHRSLLHNFVTNGIENKIYIQHIMYTLYLLQHVSYICICVILHYCMCARKNTTHMLEKHAKLHIYASSWCWHIEYWYGWFCFVGRQWSTSTEQKWNAY